MSTIYGIDVSAYQGVIDWRQVKQAGCRHSVIKITRKDLLPDRQFRANLAGCRREGIGWSVYRYVYEQTEAEAERAMAAVIRLLREEGVTGGVRIWWDVEDESIRPRTAAEKAAFSRSILAAQRSAERAGFFFGVYCNLFWYRSVLDHRTLTCPFWVARYPLLGQVDFGSVPNSVARPDIIQPLWGWQYSSKGRIDGIEGSVDLNEIYLQEDLLSQSASDKGQPIRRFQRWMKEQGEASLAADGIFGPQSRKSAIRVLQRQLNRLYRARLAVDGIFGPRTEAALVTLGRGSQGDLVLLLQGLLYAAGEDPRGLDGILGRDTEAALRAFQKKRGLSVDGLAGKKSFRALLNA
ncbi:MAG: peptidoglycan-binding protein [Oscillospiraceae bacterium]|nr:peptidoglycan-binding protein [Oscillospiraceae bacterium]